jgi:glycosyltransferase involved in cell wall biosynthesis
MRTRTSRKPEGGAVRRRRPARSIRRVKAWVRHGLIPVRLRALGRRLKNGARRALRPVRNRRIYRLARGAWRGARGGWKAAGQVDYRIASLRPDGKARGRVLIAYIAEGFFQDEISKAHTQDWEAVAMARAWADLGYHVDVVDNNNVAFDPGPGYDFFIAARMALEPIGRRLNPDCVRILHIDTAHWLYSNTASHGRSLALQHRRGLTVRRMLDIERNHAIEFADCATMVGNEFTASTYSYAKKRIYRVPISTSRLFDWAEDKDFDACRKRFVWFGSRGAVHKGLDLVLEAFALMPDFHLTVVGPVRERCFEEAYRRELYESPNIRFVGWVDLSGPDFADIARDSVGLVFPSCSEGGGGSAVACMHAGLIPIVTRQTSVDIDPSYGLELESASVVEVCSAVRELAGRAADDLERMARAAWTHARVHHTREAFEVRYREVAEKILRRHPPGAASTGPRMDRGWRGSARPTRWRVGTKPPVAPGPRTDT